MQKWFKLIGLCVFVRSSFWGISYIVGNITEQKLIVGNSERFWDILKKEQALSESVCKCQDLIKLTLPPSQCCCSLIYVFKEIKSMGNFSSISEVINAISGIQSLAVKNFLCSISFVFCILKMQSLIPWNILFRIGFPSLCTYFFSSPY